MKSRFCLPKLLLTIFLCSFFYFPRNAWTALPGTPSEQTNGTQSPESAAVSSPEEVTIPGPLRSFLRMAAISQKVSPEEVLPLLSRNVVVNGFQGGGGKPTEFLILLNWYMDQARELLTFAGPEGVIHVSNCAEAKPLLPILGYRMKQSCGPNAALETSNADRAFLTIDSGFPLSELEDTLRGGKPFVYPFTSTRVPVLFAGNDWMAAEKNGNNAKKEVVDSILRDPGMARLYWAMSRMDVETRNALWRSQGLRKLVPVAAVLDFYGSHISIRAGRVIVPGGAPAESTSPNLADCSISMRRSGERTSPPAPPDIRSVRIRDSSFLSTGSSLSLMASRTFRVAWKSGRRLCGRRATPRSLKSGASEQVVGTIPSNLWRAWSPFPA